MRYALRGALAVMVAVAVAVVFAWQSRPADQASSPTSTSSTSAPAVTSTTEPTPTTEPTTTTMAPTTTTTVVPALGPGSTGPEVLAVEQRLDELGYFVGAVDGTYDDSTLHGVTAFQKVAGIGRDGVVGPVTEEALARATRPTPGRAGGRHLEVDLAHQVLLAVDGATVHKVLDISTGKTPGLTPTGDFTLYREIDGWRHAPLGVLYRPKYYWKGLAIHGYSSVPPYPASHGCIRVTNAEMDWLWASGLADLGTPVWIR